MIYGGYGLAGASLNYEINSKRNTKYSSGQKKYYVDLFYKNEKLAVEYDSTAHHSSSIEQGKNSIRATSLELQGIEVLSLTTMQLYNKNACDEFAYKLASRLGRVIRKRAKKFKQNQTELREMFPTKHR